MFGTGVLIPDIVLSSCVLFCTLNSRLFNLILLRVYYLVNIDKKRWIIYVKKAIEK